MTNEEKKWLIQLSLTVNGLVGLPIMWNSSMQYFNDRGQWFAATICLIAFVCAIWHAILLAVYINKKQKNMNILQQFILDTLYKDNAYAKRQVTITYLDINQPQMH